MNIKTETLTEKLDLIRWVSTLEDEAVINKLSEFRRKETKDWWGQISEVEKESINRGIDEADQNALKPHSEAGKI